ncbi:MAG: zinc-dependent metalloprotease family protein [Planctomycetota bacterium]
MSDHCVSAQAPRALLLTTCSLLSVAPSTRAQVECGVEPHHTITLPAPLGAAPLLEDGSTIDVLFAYSAAARGSQSRDALLACYRSAVANMNGRLARSGVDLRMRMVHAHEIDLDDDASHTSNDFLQWLRSADGNLDQVLDLRDAVGADMVVGHFSNLSGAGGLAYTPGSLSPAFEAFAFAVVETPGLISHELGHVLGNDHFHTDGGGLFPYSYGWRYQPPGEPLRQTVMTASFAFRYSNPLILDGGVPTGDAVLADAATTITKTKQVMANFRKDFARDRYAMSIESRGTLDQQGDSFSGTAALSADGRYVAFATLSSNLDSSPTGDTNNLADIYVRDRQTGTTTRVSLGTAGQQPNGHSLAPALSSDGRYVVFESFANNLVAGDTNQARDVFVYDRVQMQTVRVSVGPGGIEADGDSSAPDVSGDGSLIAFESSATNLDPADLNGVRDIFVHDVGAATTTLVSVSSTGALADGVSGAASLSADGRHVAFHSLATNLGADQVTPNVQDVFAHDRTTGVTTLISAVPVGLGGQWAPGDEASADPDLSADGRFVAFSTRSPILKGDPANLSVTQVVLRRDRDVDEDGVFDEHGGLAGGGVGTDVTTQSTVSGDDPDGDSGPSAIAEDGQSVALQSDATDLLPGDVNGQRDVFVWRKGALFLTSATAAGDAADGISQAPAISATGSVVAFESSAKDLVTPDANGAVLDVFVRDTAIPADASELLSALVDEGLMGIGDPALRLEFPDDLALPVTAAPISGQYRASYEATLQATIPDPQAVRVVSEHSVAGSISAQSQPELKMLLWNHTTQQFDELITSVINREAVRMLTWAEVPPGDYVAADGTIRLRVEVARANAGPQSAFQVSGLWLDALLR